MTIDDCGRRSGWTTMLANLAADAVLAEAAVYAGGGRRVTVDHGQPLTPQAEHLLQQLLDEVDAATDQAGHCGGGTVTIRATSITWTYPSLAVPARELVLAARHACDRLNPGTWIITADDQP